MRGLVLLLSSRGQRICCSSILSNSLHFLRNFAFGTVNMNREEQWKIEKCRKMHMNIEEKRTHYYHKTYIRGNEIKSWINYYQEHKVNIEKKKPIRDDLTEFGKIELDNDQNKKLVQQISLFKGDITQLEIDAIVNAANSRLKAGGGVDGAIHRAAGPYLQEECNSLHGCPTGEAKITGGHNLPAKYVIHTVGPQDGNADHLRSCYENCLAHVKKYDIKCIAFPCISTGIYGFPNRLASHIALQAVRKYLETNNELKVIFCTFMPIDVDMYETLMQLYFPVNELNKFPAESVVTNY